MTILAKCREKFMKDAYPCGTIYQRPSEFKEGALNPYWEGNLNKENKEHINGYDCAVYEVQKFFEENIDEVIEEYLGAYTASRIDKDVIAEADNLSKLTLGEIAEMSKETYLLKAIYNELRQVLEYIRDEDITTLIEEQGKKE